LKIILFLTNIMLQSVIRQTLSLMSKYRTQTYALEELAEFRALVQDVDRLKLQDFGVSLEQLFATTNSEAPVNYLEVYEDGFINLSIFAIRNGDAELPLHNHPEMYGILKVLHGKVEIVQMTPVNENEIGGPRRFFNRLIPNRKCVYVKVHESIFVTPSDSPLTLSPNARNLHQIRSVDGPAAFFDVLFPKYQPPERDCHYFKVIEQWKKNGQTFATLVQKDCPSSFWCDAIPKIGTGSNLE